MLSWLQMRTWIAALGLLTLACGGDTGKTTSAASSGSTTDTTTAATTTPTGGPELGGCDCFGFEDPVVTELCPQSLSCDILTSTCLDDETHCVPSKEATLDCILAAIRTDTIGEVTWTQTLTFSPDKDFYTSDRTLHVYNFGSGQVFWSGSLYTGLTDETGGLRRFELTALGLDECAAIADAPARFDCLRAAFDSPPAEVCIEASTVF